MTITIFRKAMLWSFTCLAIGALVPNISYATDSTPLPTDQPTTKPGKFSKLREFFGSCLGCIKATEEVIEDIQETVPEITDEIEQVLDKNNTDSATKSQATVAIEDQEKMKKMTKKISKKSKKNRVKAAVANDVPPNTPEASVSKSCWGGFCSKKSNS
jgi:ElaB/YqjD/DUF883 family membrane-anchored ribosome-binding protein